MFIESVELCNYRNYEQLNIDFSDHINILYGDNAQGKTNLLEAIYIGCTTKSYRGSKEREIIHFDQDESHIKMMIDRNGSKYRIDMHLKKSKNKGIAINGIPIRRASELFGIVNIIFFSPEDLQMIKNGPIERRKFLDSELCQLDKIYLHQYTNYCKILTERNALLKKYAETGKVESEILDIYDEQLVTYGTEVIRFRREFVEQVNSIIQSIHQNITGGKEEIDLVYEPNVSEDSFSNTLFLNRERDLRSATSNFGPHRDDLSFLVSMSDRKTIDLRKYGSQGQQRSAALSLKMAEIEIVKRKTGNMPILLLDDVLSELDSNRQMQLLKCLSDTQTFITCTGLDEFVENRFQMDRIFYVENGTITVKS